MKENTPQSRPNKHKLPWWFVAVFIFAGFVTINTTGFRKALWLFIVTVFDVDVEIP